MTYSTMDSSDVAQCLRSPGAGGASHSPRVFLMYVGLVLEKRARIEGRWAEEKGMESADSRERKPPWRLRTKSIVSWVPESMSSSSTGLYGPLLGSPVFFCTVDANGSCQ